MYKLLNSDEINILAHDFAKKRDEVLIRPYLSAPDSSLAEDMVGKMEAPTDKARDRLENYQRKIR
ncbi:hypothetical protein K502DRAFT_349474 [Neoconidiobolus thromboides FSU 785]|nr:hypothetical protein K502DRAFT_349474 [Neoconidiobolus thromboides FSU 785]